MSRQPAWYGADANWRRLLEATAKNQHGRRLHVDLTDDILTYCHDGIDTTGRIDPIPVEVRFYRTPPYPCGHLQPQDYPRVFADSGVKSKHRMGDDALCLYEPTDPPQRRWTADKGLLSLLDLVADHLYAEEQWRTTGNWPQDEAPHGRMP